MKFNALLYATLLCTAFSVAMTSCSKSDSTPPVDTNTTNCSGEPGPLFLAVKSLIEQKCVGCHNANNASGGMNWTVNCNIVERKNRIKARAVDEGTMPPNGPLPQEDKDKINAWIVAGGRLSD